MSSLVGTSMVLMGAWTAGTWTVDIVSSSEVDRTIGILRARIVQTAR
jgi:hypothetical protein